MNFFDDYFVFSDSEKKGIFIFVCVLFLMIVFYITMPYIFTTEKYDFSEFKKELENKKLASEIQKSESVLFYFNPNTLSKDSLMLLGLTSKQSYNIINYRNKVGEFNSEKEFRKLYSIPDSMANVLVPFLVFDETKSAKSETQKQTVREDSLFQFDPNTANLAQLKHLGLSQKQAQTILNYKNKGGEFRKKEDLRKMYSISEKQYSKLAPFIRIDRPEKEKTASKTIEKTELNSATKSQLIAIRGIGEKTAERIIKLRNRYGGFVELSQLDEIYGLDSLIKANKSIYFELNKGELTKININTVTFKKLLAHPYCDYNSTKKIINYREMHGAFTSLEQILENNLIKAEQYRKIVKYLTLK